MGYRATVYIFLQTVSVALLGCLWLVVTGETSRISILPGAPEVIFGLVFGGSFYAYITLIELRSLSKIGSAKISVKSWVFLAGVAPTVFAVIYGFFAATPLDASVRFFNAIITFVSVGGIVRTILLFKWEKKQRKIIITSFGRELFAISK